MVLPLRHPAVLAQKSSELFDVFPHDSFLGGIAEKEGGMVQNHELDVWIIGGGEEFARLLLHREFVATVFDEILQRDRAEQQNRFRAHQLDLAAQIRETGFDFVRHGRAVDFSLALHDVDNEQVAVGVEADAGHDLVEQFARAADERLPPGIFIVAGSFADDQDFRVGIAAVDDDVIARLAAWTFLAVVGIQTFTELDVTRCRQHVVVRGVE